MSKITLDRDWMDDRFLRLVPKKGKSRIEFDRNYAPEMKGFRKGIITGAIVVFIIYSLFLVLYKLI